MSTTALEALVSSMPLSDLAERSGRSVEEIVGWAMTGSGAGTAARTPTKRQPPAPPARTVSAAPAAAPSASAPVASSSADTGSRRTATAKVVNTRTPEGRTRYDEGVLEMVRASSGPVAATSIRKKVGGTPLQVRAALNRLIEAGQVEFQGRARAMRYTAL